MRGGYRPKGNATSEGLIPPNTSSNVMKEDVEKNKTWEEVLKDKDKEIAYLKGKIDAMQDTTNDRLLELCMFALLPKKIYEHELADETKKAFKNIIKQNINEDTHTIRNKIVRYWNGK